MHRHNKEWNRGERNTEEHQTQQTVNAVRTPFLQTIWVFGDICAHKSVRKNKQKKPQYTGKKYLPLCKFYYYYYYKLLYFYIFPIEKYTKTIYLLLSCRTVPSCSYPDGHVGTRYRHKMTGHHVGHLIHLLLL